MNIDEVIQRNISSGRRLKLLAQLLEWMLVGRVMVTSLTLPSIIEGLSGTVGDSTTMASSVLSVCWWARSYQGDIRQVWKSGPTLSADTRRGRNRSHWIRPIDETVLGVQISFGLSWWTSSRCQHISRVFFNQDKGLYLTLLESSWALGSIMVGAFTMLTLDSLGWQWSYYFLFIFGIPLIMIGLFLPESPKFEFMKKGKKALEKILKTSIKEEVEMHEREKQPLLSIFKKSGKKNSHDMVQLVHSKLRLLRNLHLGAQDIPSRVNPVSSLWYTFLCSSCSFRAAHGCLPHRRSEKPPDFLFVATAFRR